MAPYHKDDGRDVDRAQVGDPIQLKVTEPVIRQRNRESHHSRYHCGDPRPRARSTCLLFCRNHIGQEAVDAMLGLGHGLLLSGRHGREGRLRHNGQVSTSRINASTPTRPLPHGNDIVSAIGFCCGHALASQKAVGPRPKRSTLSLRGSSRIASPVL